MPIIAKLGKSGNAFSGIRSSLWLFSLSKPPIPCELIDRSDLYPFSIAHMPTTVGFMMMLALYPSSRQVLSDMFVRKLLSVL